MSSVSPAINERLHYDDLIHVAQWFGDSDTQQIITRFAIVPITTFDAQITQMQATYTTFPADKKRTQAIVRRLRAGEPMQPIYIEEDDPSFFVMEGRHRLVAFYWQGIPTVTVCFCKRRPTPSAGQPD